MISFGNQRKWRGEREKEEKGETARTRVCVLPWNRSQLSVPVGAFHKDKRRIPILVVQQRNQLVDQSAALMAEFGHRHSIQSRKSYSKARPNNVAPPNSASPFHYAAGCCLPSPPSRDTSNVKSTFRERLFAIRFASLSEKGENSAKGSRRSNLASSRDLFVGLLALWKKEAADILLFPSRFIFFVDGKDFLLVFHLPSIRSPREITPIISDPSTSSNREEEEGAKSCHKSNY